MRLTAQRAPRGKHRKITTSQTKGRVALVAVAASAVSSAGIGGATAATLQAQDEAPASMEVTTVDVELAANDAALSFDATQV
ncbi:M23 family peptidase, partial [Corynebacterium hylobatis]